MSDQINLAIGDLPELKWVPLEEIRVDKNYQRDLKPRLVAKILRKFQWRKFGAVCLVDQGDGTYTVYEGQHRVAVARAHPDVSRVPAVVVKLADLQEEADAFLGINVDRAAVTPTERYWAGITAGDPELIRLRDALARAGCEVVPANGGSTGSHMTNAVTAMQRALERYGDAAFVKACKTLRLAWSDDRSAMSGIIVMALARIYESNRDMDMDRMVAQLRLKRRSQLSADAEAMRKISGGAAETNVSRTLAAMYNKGLTKNVISIGVAA